MPATSLITFRRGTTFPTAASGLSLGEPAFNTDKNTFHIGLGSGTTGEWIGAPITGLSASIDSSEQYKIPTAKAVKDYVVGYVTAVNGVLSFNGLVGNVQGVSAAVAGTGISVSGTTGSVTFTNTGVLSFNGNSGVIQGVSSWNGSTGAVSFVNYVSSFNGSTGAIQGVSAAVAGTGISVSGATGTVTFTNTGALLTANTFTELQTFNAGISAMGGELYIGTAANLVFEGSTNNNFETTLTVTDPTADRTITLPNATGTIALTDSPILITPTLGVATATSINTPSIITNIGDTNHLTVSPYGNVALAPIRSSYIGGDFPHVTITNADQGLGEVKVEGGNLFLGVRSDSDFNQYSVDIVFEGSSTNSFETTLTVAEPTADRTITLPNNTGTIALTSQLMGTVNGSTADTTTVTSFNGRTGAVQGVSAAVAGTGISVSGATGTVTFTNTGALLTANTFTGLQTFNAGISASGGITFNTGINIPVDTTYAIRIGTDATRKLSLSNTAGNSFITQIGSSNRTLRISHEEFGRIEIGDAALANNGNYILVDDANGVIDINSGTLNLNGSTISEVIQDTSSTMITGGSHTGISTSYIHGAGTLSITNLGVTSFNGRTGAVQGVSAAVAGTGISVSGATGTVTITNIGVQSLNGKTGAVGLVSGNHVTITANASNGYTADWAFNPKKLVWARSECYSVSDFFSHVSGGLNSFAVSEMGDDNHQGVLRSSTQLTASGRAGLGTTPTDQLIFAGTTSGIATYNAIVYIPTLGTSTERFYVSCGFMNSFGSFDQPLGGLMFRYKDDVISGRWQCYSSNGDGAETTVDSGITANSEQWYCLEFTLNPGTTTAVFKIDGTTVGTITTNLPVGLAPVAADYAYMGAVTGITKTVGTTARFLHIDYMEFKKEVNR